MKKKAKAKTPKRERATLGQVRELRSIRDKWREQCRAAYLENQALARKLSNLSLSEAHWRKSCEEATGEVERLNNEVSALRSQILRILERERQQQTTTFFRRMFKGWGT